MEYTPVEQDVLDLMKRTDFKNISKGEIISFASKLGELRPEVAKEVLAQFPEFVGLMKQVQADCSKLLDNPNLPPEIIMEILNREAELVKIANEKDTEIREQLQFQLFLIFVLKDIDIPVEDSESIEKITVLVKKHLDLKVEEKVY